MQDADQIIFLNFSRWNCLLRAFKRYLTYRGKVRESMAAGCQEQFNWEFIRWILWDGRSKSAKERYKWIQKNYPYKVVFLRSQKEIYQFLDKKRKSSNSKRRASFFRYNYSAIKVSNPTFIISVKVFWRSSAVVSSSGLTKLSEIVMIARAST